MANAPADRRRRLRRIAAACAVAGVLLGVRAALTEVARRAAQRIAAEELGMAVSVGEADLSLLGTWIALRDVVVLAPEGFERREAFRADELLVDFDGLKRRTYAVAIERIEARGVRAYFERDPELGASLVAGRRIAGERKGPEPKEPRRRKETPATPEDVIANGASLHIDSVSLADVSVEWIDRKRSGRAPTVRASWSLLRSGRVTFDRDAGEKMLQVADAGATDFALAFDAGGETREVLRVERATMTVGETSDRRIFYLDAVVPRVEFATDSEGESDWESMGDSIRNAMRRGPLESGADAPEDDPPKNDAKDPKSKRPPRELPKPPRDVVVTATVGEFVRRAEIDGVERVQLLRDAVLRAELGGSEAERIALSARDEDGVRTVLDFDAAGVGLSDTGAIPSYAGRLVLDGFPWHVALWPREERDDSLALVRAALVSGSVDFRTGSDGSAIEGTLRFSGVDARPDRRSPLRRIADGGTSASTWLADMAAAQGPDPKPLELSARSADASLPPVALFVRAAEAFARARVEAAAGEP